MARGCRASLIEATRPLVTINKPQPDNNKNDNGQDEFMNTASYMQCDILKFLRQKGTAIISHEY